MSVYRKQLSRGQEGHSEEVIFALKTQHKSVMRREEIAFSVHKTAKAKAPQGERELFKPEHCGEPQGVEHREQTRWGWRRRQGPGLWALWDVVRTLDFTPSAIRSHWKAEPVANVM